MLRVRLGWRDTRAATGRVQPRGEVTAPDAVDRRDEDLSERNEAMNCPQCHEDMHREARRYVCGFCGHDMPVPADVLMREAEAQKLTARLV